MAILTWQARLQALRQRTDALISSQARPGSLPLDAAVSGYAILRAVARPLLEEAAGIFRAVCPPGYPAVEDNGIPGPGGSVGVRFSAWHAFHIAFENVKQPKKAEPKPAGLAGGLNIRVRRMPGDPLPPRDRSDRFELALLALRWDEGRGWVEVRRVLPAEWTEEMVAELFGAYLIGFCYDVAAGLPPRPNG